MTAAWIHSVRAESEVNDISFARMILLIMGAVFVLYGLVANAGEGIVGGAAGLLGSIYISAVQLPKHRRLAEEAKIEFDVALTEITCGEQ